MSRLAQCKSIHFLSPWMFSSHLSVSRTTPPIRIQMTTPPSRAVGLPLCHTSLCSLSSPPLWPRREWHGGKHGPGPLKCTAELLRGRTSENSIRTFFCFVCLFLGEQEETCPALFHSARNFESARSRKLFWHDKTRHRIQSTTRVKESGRNKQKGPLQWAMQSCQRSEPLGRKSVINHLMTSTSSAEFDERRTKRVRRDAEICVWKDYLSSRG